MKTTYRPYEGPQKSSWLQQMYFWVNLLSLGGLGWPGLMMIPMLLLSGVV